MTVATDYQPDGPLNGSGTIEIAERCTRLLEQGEFAALRELLGVRWSEAGSETDRQQASEALLSRFGFEAVSILLEGLLQQGEFRRGTALAEACVAAAISQRLERGAILCLKAIHLHLSLFHDARVVEVGAEARAVRREAESLGDLHATARASVVEADALLLGEQAGLTNQEGRVRAQRLMGRAAILFDQCGLRIQSWATRLKIGRFFEKELGLQRVLAECRAVGREAGQAGAALVAGFAWLRYGVLLHRQLTATGQLARSTLGAGPGHFPWRVELALHRGVRSLRAGGSALTEVVTVLARLEAGDKLEPQVVEQFRTQCATTEYLVGEIELLQRLVHRSRGDLKWVRALRRAAARAGFGWAEISTQVTLLERAARNGDPEVIDHELRALAGWKDHPTFAPLVAVNLAGAHLVVNRPEEVLHAARRAVKLGEMRTTKVVASQARTLIAQGLERLEYWYEARAELRTGIRRDLEWQFLPQALSKGQLLCLQYAAQGAKRQYENPRLAAPLFRAAHRTYRRLVQFEERRIHDFGEPANAEKSPELRRHGHRLQLLGQIFYLERKLNDALRVLSQARAVFEELADLLGLGFTDSLLGSVCLALGRERGDQELVQHGEWLRSQAAIQLSQGGMKSQLKLPIPRPERKPAEPQGVGEAGSPTRGRVVQ